MTEVTEQLAHQFASKLNIFPIKRVLVSIRINVTNNQKLIRIAIHTQKFFSHRPKDFFHIIKWLVHGEHTCDTANKVEPMEGT